MPFTLSQFATTRPYLYHLTSRRNLDRLLQERIIYSTAELLRKAQNEEWLVRKRGRVVTIHLEGVPIDLRDQRPLYEGKTRLQGGWTFSDLIRHLNERVFFWPGWEHKPIDYGRRHYETYTSERPAIIRVKTSDLFSENDSTAPLFCKYNSGSPRTVNGLGSPRGPDTFVACDSARYTASLVKEVTFVNSVQLPAAIESASSPFGPWTCHS